MLLFAFGCTLPDAPRSLSEEVGELSDTAVVWGGFRQRWGYNHRINNLGDHVRPVRCDASGCSAEVVHAAASGLGSDTAEWASHYTGIRAERAVFLGGSTRLEIEREGAQGAGVAESATVRVSGGAALGQGVHVVLNGFDILARSDADKLQRLSIDVGDARVDADDVVFAVDVRFVFDCSSIECDARRGDVAYDVLVSWLLVGGEAAVNPVSAETAYTWTNHWVAEELDLELPRAADTARGVGGYDTGVLAFTGLAVELDDEHHMAEWATVLHPGTYADGALPFEANLAFKQWNTGTWWHPLSYTSPGSAALRADLALIELDGCAAAGAVGGAITWEATGGPASEAAVDVAVASVPACG